MPVGPTELIIVLVIVLVIFGAGKLGDVGKGFGKSIKEFREATKEEDKPAPPKDSAAPKDEV